MNPELAIELALIARVQTLALTPALRIAWPNQPFTAADGETYIEVAHLPNRNQRLFIGSTDPHLRQGILQLTIRGHQNQNAINLTAIASAVAAHFPADLRMTSNGVTVRVQRAPDIAPGFKDDPHWVVPVSVSYEAFA